MQDVLEPNGEAAGTRAFCAFPWRRGQLLCLLLAPMSPHPKTSRMVLPANNGLYAVRTEYKIFTPRNHQKTL